MPELVTVNGLTSVAVAADATAPALPGAAAAMPRPPVLFVPGMMACARIFERYQRFFASRGYASWALNLRGHCGSRPVGAAFGHVSMSDYVDDALEAARSLAAAFGVERPLVVGHSMGGLIAQKLAERGAVDAAVLLCAAPPRGIPLASLLLARHQASYLWPIVRGQPISVTRAAADALNFNRVPLAERDALFEQFVPESGRVGLELSVGSVAVDAESVRCPLLVCAATDDRLVPARIARRLAKKYGERATHREFAGHGHLVLLEPGWELPADEIVRWLDGVVLGLGSRV